MSKSYSFILDWEYKDEDIKLDIEFTIGYPATYWEPGDNGEMEIIGGYYEESGKFLTDDELLSLNEDDDGLFQKAADKADEEHWGGYDDGDMAYDLSKGN